MEFDEIEYLEKTVGEKGHVDDTRKSKRGSSRSYSKRDGEEVDEERHRSKKSKVGDDENGHEKSGRDKDRDRRTRDRDSGRDRARRANENEKDDKDRERIRDRERSHREEERSRRVSERKEGDRVRDNDREKEKDREGSREREKDKERRERRERMKEREREGHDYDRDTRERSRSSSKPRRNNESEKERDFETRDSRKYKEKKENPEAELDPERDQKTVFAYQILMCQMPLKATERDVYEFFSKAGKVRDVRLIMDRNSRRSKGVGYIEFYDPMAVPMAIALCGQLLMGQPVMVKPSEAEKNLVQSNSSSGGAGGAGIFGPVDRKLYVGNLHFNMTELQLRQTFEPYGTVELVQMPLDLETGHCKGFGFIQFASVESAKIAQMELNGKLEIAGRYIKISSVTEHGGQIDNFPKNTDLDDDEGGGLALNAQSRALLMQKLDRTGTAASIVGGIGIPVVNQAAPILPNGQTIIGPTLPAHVVPSESVGQPSECLLLKNMFDPATETEPDFDLEIKEDVETECSNYGRVKHIHVDRNSGGFVYVRFLTVEAAAKAQRAMHMRWFAQRSISAIFLQPRDYEAKFGK